MAKQPNPGDKPTQTEEEWWEQEAKRFNETAEAVRQKGLILTPALPSEEEMAKADKTGSTAPGGAKQK